MPDYAGMQNPWEAILQCLLSHGNLKLTETELIEEIAKGGFKPHTPKMARALLKDMIAYQRKKGFLEEKDGKLGRTLKARK